MTSSRNGGGTGSGKRHVFQLHNTNMCKYYFGGRCEKGDRCSYAHSMDEVRQKPDLTCTSMCRTMLHTGQCLDTSCLFAHSEAELRVTQSFFKTRMCAWSRTGQCKNGLHCRFAHSQTELQPKPQQSRKNGASSSEAASSSGGAAEGSASLQEGTGVEVPAVDPGASMEDDAPVAVASKLEQPKQHSPASGSRAQAAGSGLQAGGGGGKKSLQQPKRPQQPQKPPLPPPNAKLQRNHRPPPESDFADASSSTSGNGSNDTEVPHSEHNSTGSPHATSTCSSRNSANGSSSSTGSNGSCTGQLGSFSTKAANQSASSGASTAAEPGPQPKVAGHSGDSRRMPPSGERGSQGSAAGCVGPEGPEGVAHWGGDAAEYLAPQAQTLLVLNVPSFLTQLALLGMFEDLSPEIRGKFDFFYCPWNEQERFNLGYAVVNFVDPIFADTFQQTWSQKHLCGMRGQKPLKVKKATLQGLQANLEYFSRVAVTDFADLRFSPLFRAADGMLRPLSLVKEAAENAALQPQPEPPPTWDRLENSDQQWELHQRQQQEEQESQPQAPPQPRPQPQVQPDLSGGHAQHRQPQQQLRQHQPSHLLKHMPAQPQQHQQQSVANDDHFKSPLAAISEEDALVAVLAKALQSSKTPEQPLPQPWPCPSEHTQGQLPQHQAPPRLPKQPKNLRQRPQQSSDQPEQQLQWEQREQRQQQQQLQLQQLRQLQQAQAQQQQQQLEEQQHLQQLQEQTDQLQHHQGQRRSQKQGKTRGSQQGEQHHQQGKAYGFVPQHGLQQWHQPEQNQQLPSQHHQAATWSSDTGPSSPAGDYGSNRLNAAAIEYQPAQPQGQQQVEQQQQHQQQQPHPQHMLQQPLQQQQAVLWPMMAAMPWMMAGQQMHCVMVPVGPAPTSEKVGSPVGYQGPSEAIGQTAVGFVDQGGRATYFAQGWTDDTVYSD